MIAQAQPTTTMAINSYFFFFSKSCYRALYRIFLSPVDSKSLFYAMELSPRHENLCEFYAYSWFVRSHVFTSNKIYVISLRSFSFNFQTNTRKCVFGKHSSSWTKKRATEWIEEKKSYEQNPIKTYLIFQCRPYILIASVTFICVTLWQSAFCIASTQLVCRWKHLVSFSHTLYPSCIHTHTKHTIWERVFKMRKRAQEKGANPQLARTDCICYC